MTMSATDSRRKQGMEWELDKYVDTDTWERSRVEGLGTINLGLTYPGSTYTLTSSPMAGESKRFNDFTATKFCGSTRQTQYENDKRAELKAHVSRRGQANVVAYPVKDVGRAERMKQLYSGLEGLPCHPPQDNQTDTPAPRRGGNASLEKSWRDKLPDCDDALLTLAMTQMKGANAGKVDASDLVLPAPSFSHDLAGQKLKTAAQAPREGGSALMPAGERRRRAEEEIQQLRAQKELGRVRRVYKHLEFVASKRHNNGVLMSEDPDESPSGVYTHIAQKVRSEEGVVERERKMRTVLQSGNQRNGQILYHTATLEDAQKPFIPRKNHSQRLKDTFSLSTMGDPVGKHDPARAEKLIYADTRGNDRDIITGIVSSKQIPASPYA